MYWIPFCYHLLQQFFTFYQQTIYGASKEILIAVAILVPVPVFWIYFTPILTVKVCKHVKRLCRGNNRNLAQEVTEYGSATG